MWTWMTPKIQQGGGVVAEVWEKLAIATINVTGSNNYVGTAVDISAYAGGEFDLKFNANVTAPDTEDAWEIKIQKRYSSSDDWVDLAYWVDTVNEGDLVTTSGDPTRGRFSSDVLSGQHEQIFIENLTGDEIRVLATAYDENSDGDMALNCTVTAFLRKRDGS